ncbi:regulator of hemoglobinization and erythroid cell expansion protein [Callospermophilus lateralis]
MKLWHGLVIAVLSLFLQICLLMALNYLLSRNIAHQSERILKEARIQVRERSPSPRPFPLAKETWKEPAPQYRHESNTSSDSSISSVSLNNPATLPSTFQAIKDVNYTPVVFSAPESVLDYENIKEATDYVNVNPEKPKPKIWTSVNASFIDPVEYTQVAV